MKHFYINPETLLGGIVYSNEKQEIVHLSLRKGNTVPSYVMNAEINLFLIDGSVELITEQVSTKISPRELVVLEPNLSHQMTALEDSQILVVKVR